MKVRQTKVFLARSVIRRDFLSRRSHYALILGNFLPLDTRTRRVALDSQRNRFPVDAVCIIQVFFFIYFDNLVSFFVFRDRDEVIHVYCLAACGY